MDTKLSLQSLPDADVFSPCSIEHQDVFMYDDERRSELESDSPTYLDISSNKSAQFPGIKSEPEIDTLMSWTQKHPENWTQNEILDWIYFVAGTIDVDHTTIRGEGFQNITGPELCRMTLEDFQKRDPVNGKCFFDMFKSLHKDAFFSEPPAGDFTPMDQQQYSFAKPQIKSEFRDTTSCCQAPSMQLEHIKPFDSITVNESEMQVKLGEFWYTIDCQELDDVITPQYWPSEIGYSSSDSESVSDISDRDSPAPATIYNDYHHSHRHGQRNNSLGSDILSDDDYSMSVVPSAAVVEGHRHKAMAQKRKPASQRKKHNSGGSGGDGDKQQNRGRKPGQLSKGNHLWEFIRDLLKDAKFNPHLLRWEEKETGVFRFVQSEAVAQMWGRKKNNPGMTYEKLSRAMRFCRTAGYFSEVPKTGKFPKKLCFRFGPKAFGWED